MTKSYDAIIIGAGIIGCATSLALARKGWKVLNLDRLPAAGYGSTSGSCAIIRPYYSTLDGSAMAYESHFYWKNWAEYLGAADIDERGLIEYHNVGSMVMKTELNDFMRPTMALMDELDSPYSEYSPEQLKEKLPVWNTESFFPVKLPGDPEFGIANKVPLPGAVLFHAAGYISDPQLATHNIMRAAEAVGSEFKYNAQVIEIRSENDKVCGVTLEGGEHIDSPVVLNAAGPHSSKINQMAGVEENMKVKTRALRQEVAHVPLPEGYNYETACVTSDSDIGVYTRPEQGNNLLIGSEDPPVDIPEFVDPDDYNHDFTDQWTAQVLRVCQRVPELSVPNKMQGVVDLYDVTDDWIPIYDKSDLPGFYMAIGTSGNQFKNAPIAGELMANIIEATEQGNDQDKNPIDLHLKYIDRKVTSGFYSRLREINQDSSFSVLG
ncbi:MAG: sarcosine oxidase subunit beta [Planctomycetota bacterium]|jgi:sarcosine oxidase subunit beta